ncbi:hypothetical protein [Ectobacillus ponti]|uniref:Uncharacterized protein n=1 Tax=Ectobacillus ponti TaxID=2961894 RepID=A0AA41X5T8_9BACI|nr:hypothetical protein [Ectobacillus ponti]MCP8969317.1 hypothetical protein [Ectobacillus ponti]
MEQRGRERGSLTKDELQSRIQSSGILAENEQIRYTRDDSYVYVLRKNESQEMTGVTLLYWNEFARRMQQTIEKYLFPSS